MTGEQKHEAKVVIDDQRQHYNMAPLVEKEFYMTIE
jgi:hypothetical protein